MNKKGTSIVELVAIIIIMGVIASFASVTIIVVINRQKKNATLNSLNTIYNSATTLLVQVETTTYDSNISFIDDDFCYISLTTLIDSGNVDGESYKPEGNEIYFCYNMQEAWVVILASDPTTKVKPSTTGITIVNSVEITFDYHKDKFIGA